jgi:small conductance mechanosensitive channel
MDLFAQQPLVVRNLVTLGGALLLLLILFGALRWLVGRIVGLASRAVRSEALQTATRALAQNLRLLTTFAGLLACVAVAGGGVWLWLKEDVDLFDWTVARVRDVPPAFWLDLGLRVAKALGVAIVVALLLRTARRLLEASARRVKAWEGLQANDESIDSFFGSLRKIITRGAWLGFLAWGAGTLGGTAEVTAVLWLAVRMYVIVALGLLAWRALDAVIASLDALSRKYAAPTNVLRYYDRLSDLVPVMRKALEYALWVMVGTLAVAQIARFEDTAQEWGPRLVSVIGIVFLARTVVEIAKLLTEQMLLEQPKLDRGTRQRRATIVPLLHSVLQYVIYFGAGVMVLGRLGLDPTPILAGAGILGLAVGLGAQSLVNDMVSGFFILFEDYYLVGDFVSIDDAEGVVERVDLRTTRIRDTAGRHHILRNGNIDTVVNYSKQYAFAVVEVGVAYESDLDAVVAALAEAGEQLRKTNDKVLEPTVIKGLNAFGESELTYRTITKVRPGAHLDVERALRRIIKDVFDARGIEIPYARRVLIVQRGDEGALTGAESGA